MACIEFNNNRVYAIEHKFTNTKKCCKTHFKKCKFFKEKYGEEDALAIIYESNRETTLENQSDQSQKKKHKSKLQFFPAIFSLVNMHRI